MELRFDVIDLPYVGLPNLPSGRKGLGPINRNMSRSLPPTTQAISYWDSPQVLESMGSLQLVPQTQHLYNSQSSIRSRQNG
ncbi:unnamed protein product [Arabidopsis lyrata]|uniref:Uncharacterized protein n=1 Tax=Arabidopsis lyrata subsp. lyrata TaxID=81972 RepID=D7L0G6_ARALL|nr:hypothetical protein ARALYDRAFT_896337 [Arabidopsis lyrata subsp. lyrata]CAH8259155.1 unnamed protein product [Arabidopsis lyrata]